MATLKHVPLKIDRLSKGHGISYEGKIPVRVAMLMRRYPNNFNLFGPRWWTGIVVKRKMEKTATVVVKHRKKHPMLRTKYIRTIKKYHVHDPLERTAIGDKILFEKSRPFSKTKHWIFSAWVQRSPTAEFLANNPEFYLDIYEQKEETQREKEYRERKEKQEAEELEVQMKKEKRRMKK